MNGLACLSGQTALVSAPVNPSGCSDCEHLWREYDIAARTYASMMHAEHVFADEPEEMPAIIEAIRSAAAVWFEARTALLMHDRIHERAQDTFAQTPGAPDAIPTFGEPVPGTAAPERIPVKRTCKFPEADSGLRAEISLVA